MAIEFPREMPCPVTGDVVFALQHMQARALTGGGAQQVVDLGPPLWRGRWAITARSGGPAEAWFAWASTLRGGLRLFKGRPKRRWPLSRPTGFTGLQGLGVLSGIGANRDSVTVTDLSNGLALAPGDFLSLPVGQRQHLHEIVNAAVVAGGGVTLSIEPPLHPSAVINTEVRLDGPWCDMALTAAPDRVSSLATGSVSFEGLQVLI